MPTKPLRDKLKTVRVPKSSAGPVWKGPEVDGVTQSMLSRFLCCRERFRVQYVLGWKPADAFNPAVDYGNMWHVAEEATSAGKPWQPPTLEYAKSLAKKYPMQQQAVADWHAKLVAQYPMYLEYWSKHPDVVDRVPLGQETVFDVKYKLPSGRTVRLRGKRDGEDLIGKPGSAGVWLQENKTKSSIDQQKIHRQMGFDLQTMLYVLTLRTEDFWDRRGGRKDRVEVKGVRYNVIRRSAHKSVESMVKKIQEDYAENRAGEWFSRWQVSISDQDVDRFRRECLDPILDCLCSWYTHVTNEGDVFDEPFSVDGRQTYIHWRHPFGVRNILDEGGFSDLDEYLATGSTVGLVRSDELFPELK